VVIVPIGDSAADQAAAALTAGRVVALPTDTVYGLAVDAFHQGATARLFAAKRRPYDVDLPVLIGDPDDVARLASDVPPVAAELIARWWPGPLTLVLWRRPGLDIDLGTSTRTVGIRCPDAPFLRNLARRIGPLAVTSANRHGDPTPTNAFDVASVFSPDDVALVVDGGLCDGEPSTVVDVTTGEPRILRQGALSIEG
jgi:L-threonylcarbamoyladenylate synthase